MIRSESMRLDPDAVVEISRPLFYGYIALSAVSVLEMPEYTGTMLGLSILASLSFVSAGLSKGINDDWQNFLELISVISLLTAVLFGSYLAASFSAVF